MKESRGQERQRSSERQLEEILQDPNANWSDIRKAIKAHAHAACTNAALISAIAGGVSSSEVMSTRDAVHPSTSLVVPSLTSASGCHEGKNAKKESVNDYSVSLGDGFDDFFVPTHEEPPASTYASGVNTPSRRQRRRSSAFLTRSVNSMDFGVDHFVEQEEERSKFKRNDSVVSNYTCDSDGFIGWKNDNEESSSKSETTNLSSYCDDDGFLTWAHASSATAAKESTAPKTKSFIALGVVSEDTQALKKFVGIEAYDDNNGSGPTKVTDDVKGPMDFLSFISRHSANASAVEIDQNSIAGSDLESEESQTQRKSWHIEDYEGFNDSVPTLASADSKSSMSFFPFVSRRKLSAESRVSECAEKETGLDRKEPLWKKIVSVSNIKSGQGLRSSPQIETFELKDVRQALLNVRNNSSSSRTTTEIYPTDTIQTAGINNAKAQYSTEDVSKHIQPLRSTNLLSVATTHSKTGRQEKKCLGFMSLQRSHEEKQPKASNINHVTFSSATNHDTREAIWIKRTDGGVDIKKECRKIYLGTDTGGGEKDD